jgi:hypothetical protein
VKRLVQMPARSRPVAGAREGEPAMLCPDTDFDCDNPGCRHGGCQGRRPTLPLFKPILSRAAATPAALDPAMIRAAKPAEPALPGTDRA